MNLKNFTSYLFMLLLISINLEFIFKLAQYFIGNIIVLYKDILFMLILFFSIIIYFNKKKIKQVNLLPLYLIGSFFILVLSFYVVNITIPFEIYWNIRTTILFPLILSLYFSLLNTIDFKRLNTNIIKLIKIFLILNLFLGCLQFYLQSNYYTIFHIPIDDTLIKNNSVLGMIRVPGFFRSNESLGFFSLLSIIILIFDKTKYSKKYILIAFLLILISTSRTSIIGLFVFYLAYKSRSFINYYFIPIAIIPISFVIYYKFYITTIINILSNFIDKNELSLISGSLIARFNGWSENYNFINNMEGIHLFIGSDYQTVNTIDNLYLFIFIHYGFVGFLVLLSFLFAVLFKNPQKTKYLTLIITFLYMGIFLDLIQNILFQVYVTYLIFYLLNTKEKDEAYNRFPNA